MATTVLIVDDHLKFMKFLEVDLKIHDFTVVTASSGENALETVKSDKPDLMILDIRMPQMNGFKVLQELRQFSEIPVIAYSATPEHRDLALNSGADAFMEKPFDMDGLIGLIHELTG